MNLSEFEDLLDRYGADSSAWPAELKPRAEVLLAESSGARSKHEAALRVDAALSELGATAHEAPSFLASRIVANTPPVNSLDLLFGWLTSSLWRPAATALLPLLLGFGAGTLTDQSADLAELDGYVFVEQFEEELDLDEF